METESPPLVKIVFRVDSSKEIGIGHAMRCLTLAEELRNQGAEVVFVSRFIEDFIQRRADLLRIPIQPISAETSSDEVQQICFLSPDVVVVDGYHFSNEYFSELERFNPNYAVIVDHGEQSSGNAKLLINPSPGASAEDYESRPGRAVAIGYDFSILRPEIRFLPRRIDWKNSRQAWTVLVAIGGTDALNMGPRIALHLQANFELDIFLAGKQVPPTFKAAPADIAEILSEIDLAIVGAGTTLLETTYLGIPTVALVVADNQVPNATWAEQNDLVEVVDIRGNLALEEIARRVGCLQLKDNLERREELVANTDVDGEGARRVASLILGILK